jgi:uncharacterized protein (TIGR03790 family)
MMIKSRVSLVIALLTGAGLFMPCGAPAQSRGDEVVVIYNKRLPESKAVADHYVARRGVPSPQVLALELPTTEEISRETFEKELQEPLLRATERNRWLVFDTRSFPATNGHPARSESYVRTAQVRYVVLCYGVPVRILPDPKRNEPTATNMTPELQRNEAAVDSELAALPYVKQKPPLSGIIRNYAHGTTNTAYLHPTNGVLMVSRLDGPSVSIARGLVDKALEAERDGLWGRAYFDVRGLPKGDNYFPGDEWIRGASLAAKVYGFDVFVDENPGTFPVGFPLSQVALYAGWYDTHVSGPFSRSDVEFMPGAIAYHLHSFSAATLRSVSQHWVGPLLARGAAATMGSVTEPYLNGTPDVHLFFNRLMLFGFTFGEAAYAAQNGLSWQTTVIGDPLYRPFGREPAELHYDLQHRHSPMLAWSEERVVNLNLLKKAPLIEVENYLHELEMARTNAVLLEKLADVYDLRGKSYSAAHSRLKALRWSPSPQQSVRLVLTALPQLLAQQRHEEALGALQGLLREQPEHPDRLTLLKAALPVARHLQRKEAVDQLVRELRRLDPSSVPADLPGP